MTEQGRRPDAEPAATADRYRHLPEPVRIEETISTKEVEPAPDPDAGRDAERDFMLRYAG